MPLSGPSPSMYVSRGVRKAPAAKQHAAYLFGAPVNGLDTTQTLSGSDQSTAIKLENLIPRAYGCALRSGYVQWATLLGGEVRTLMNYQSPTAEKMFAAASNGGVSDITVQSAMPPSPLFFTPTADVLGEWSWTNFSNEFGHFLLAVSPGAGYWVYNGTTWTQVTKGTGTGQISDADPLDPCDPQKFAYVFAWKGFVAFVERNSARVWYLPYGQYAGAATLFDFGPQLPHGGAIDIICNWTVDGGDGIDDKFVIFGHEGDVVIYGGTDPNDASTFAKQGSWYVGRLPVGRRCVIRYSNDLAVLSERGLSFLSELLRGRGFFMNAETAQRVNAELSKAVKVSMNGRYWELQFLPNEQLILINTPTLSAIDMQWAYEVNTKAFCTLAGMPMLNVELALGRTYFGDADGNVWQAFTGNSDGAREVGGQPVQGKDLEGVVISAFMPFGEAIREKIFHMVRPAFLSSSPPAVKVSMNPDWIFNAPSGTPIFSPSFGASFWDSAIWNVSVWGGAQQSYAAWVGVQGMGFYGALAMKVRGTAGTTFVSWQAIVEAGGIL